MRVSNPTLETQFVRSLGAKAVCGSASSSTALFAFNRAAEQPWSGWMC